MKREWSSQGTTVILAGRKPKFPMETSNIWNINKTLRSLTIVYRARGNVDFYYYTTTYLRAKAVYDRSFDEEQWASEMERFPVKNGGKASNGTKEVHHEKSWRRR